MSKFRVGQRVRIVGKWRGYGHSRTGEEAVIIEGPGSFRGGRTGLYYTWKVRSETHDCVVANSDELEPITDCYDITTWQNCVWQPEHLRVTV